MTIKLTIIMAFFAFVTTTCNGQTDKEEKILGNWELIDNDQKILLYFQEAGMVDFNQNGQQYKANFKFTSDTILQLGSTNYNILKLSKKELIIETVGFLTSEFHYQKTEKKLKPIEEFETISENYPNGQKKTEGKYHNGFEEGKWTEWYENGQLKSIQNFKDAIPIGKQELWFENRQKKEEKEFDKQHQLIYLTRWNEDGKVKQEIKN